MLLYNTQLAPNPRRVRIFMAEKGIECEIVELNIVQGDNLKDDFLKVNPRGLLPTLVLDDGTVLCESTAICRYFEETVPDPALMGTDPVSKAVIESRAREMEFDGLMSAAEAFRNSFPGFAKRGLSGNHGDVDAIPELAARGKAGVARFFSKLDASLGEQEYVAGDSYSIADIVALCAVEFATTAARVAMPENVPNLTRWHGTVSARPSAGA